MFEHRLFWPYFVSLPLSLPQLTHFNGKSTYSLKSIKTTNLCSYFLGNNHHVCFYLCFSHLRSQKADTLSCKVLVSRTWSHELTFLWQISVLAQDLESCIRNAKCRASSDLISKWRNTSVTWDERQEQKQWWNLQCL